MLNWIENENGDGNENEDENENENENLAHSPSSERFLCVTTQWRPSDIRCRSAAVATPAPTGGCGDTGCSLAPLPLAPIERTSKGGIEVEQEV